MELDPIPPLSDGFTLADIGPKYAWLVDQLDKTLRSASGNRRRDFDDPILIALRERCKTILEQLDKVHFYMKWLVSSNN